VSLIEDYLNHIVQIVSTIPNCKIDYYSEQTLSSTRANLRFKVHLSADAFVEIGEAIELRNDILYWLSYRYHFQHGDRFFRYDNAPHHPEVETHPEHKHNGMLIEASIRPTLATFLREASANLNS
jgi:hypothetical protein